MSNRPIRPGDLVVFKPSKHKSNPPWIGLVLKFVEPHKKFGNSYIVLGTREYPPFLGTPELVEYELDEIQLELYKNYNE